MKLISENLEGIWGGIPLAWDKGFSLDEQVYRENLSRLVKDGIQGIYINGTAGEFYALSWDDFKFVVDVFVDELKGSGVLTQVGCCATHTAEVIRMMEYAEVKGADGVQVVIPFWKKLNEIEVIQFFSDISSACPDLSIIHYDNDNSKWELHIEHYEKIFEVCPNLVGIKHRPDLSSIQQMSFRLPEVNCFVTEDILASAYMVGARGSYATLPYINPEFSREYWRAIKQQDWTAALNFRKTMCRFFMEVDDGLDYDGPGIDKLLGIASGYLKGSVRVRKPFLSPSHAQVSIARKIMEEKVPSLLWKQGGSS